LFFDSQCRIDSSALGVHTCIYVDSSAVLSTCSQSRFISSEASAQRASFCDRQTDRQTHTHTHTHSTSHHPPDSTMFCVTDRQTDTVQERPERVRCLRRTRRLRTARKPGTKPPGSLAARTQPINWHSNRSFGSSAVKGCEGNYGPGGK